LAGKAVRTAVLAPSRVPSEPTWSELVGALARHKHMSVGAPERGGEVQAVLRPEGTLSRAAAAAETPLIRPPGR